LVDEVVVASSGVSSSVCRAMKLLCFEVGLGAKSVVDVVVTVLVDETVSLSLGVGEIMS
jgi:hypothetical protein